MLWHDKTGLLLMFLMPVLLVFIITIIQDSAFKIVNENKISLLIVNKDSGKQGDELTELLAHSKFFTISQNNALDTLNITKVMNSTNQITGIIIPHNFSDKLRQKSKLISNTLLEELDLIESEDQSMDLDMPTLKYYHDPVLQENYSSSIVNIVNALIKTIESDMLITEICHELELTEAPEKLQKVMTVNEIPIESIAATLSENDITPNSSQHNVPAWTIFAIFFMVIPLGSNIVKERLNGSFVRLKTMPTSFTLILGSKLIVYLIAVILQVILIFSLAKLTFKSIGLPELSLPQNMFAFAVVVIMTGLTAISFSSAIGITAKTQEQANGFGAVSIIILAAIGGILVPSFVMPQYMQVLSLASPLHWCLESFYTLFLRGGDWAVLLPDLAGLLIFSLICFGFTFLQLKKKKII